MTPQPPAKVPPVRNRTRQVPLAQREVKVSRDWVAMVLAFGIASAVNLITLAVLAHAMTTDTFDMSENATQVLTAGFGGMIGILGGYVGFRAGVASREGPVPDPNDPDVDLPG